MSNKKKLVEDYINSSAKPKIPFAKNNGSQPEIAEEKSAPKKEYKSHKIYDSPQESFTQSNLAGETIISAPTSQIYVVSYKKDRNNLTDESVAELAEGMKNQGQLQPCEVRLKENEIGQKYELIFGERRYRAAILAGLPLKVVVREITDYNAALHILAENNERKDTSDFEKFLQMKEFLDSSKILKQKDLVIHCGYSKQSVSRFMSYGKIPNEINEVIADYSMVSSSTAEIIATLSKDSSLIPYIVEISTEIASGLYGNTKIRQYVAKRQKAECVTARKKITKKLITNSGANPGTKRRDPNECITYNFNRYNTDLIDSGALSKEQEEALDTEVANLFERYMALAREQSVDGLKGKDM